MKKITFIVSLFLTSQFAKAQDVESILLAGDDASELTENYIGPLMKGFMYSMNGGWYHTGRTHQKNGFDITINASASFVPTSEEVFKFIQNDYTFLSHAEGDGASINTLLSTDDNGSIIEFSIPDGNNRFKVGSFEIPGGVGSDLPLNAVPMPMVQIGYGLPKKTDLKLRFVPKIYFGDGEVSLIGVGIQHDLIQYFNEPEIPLFVSLLAAYTNVRAGYNILDDNPSDDINITNGAAEFKMNTWTLQVLGSLNYKLIAFYAGVGYNGATSSINVNGEYGLSYDIEDGGGNTIETVSESVTDPVSLEFDANGLRATIGTRLNLGVFKIFGDYTLQKYDTLSAGIAFSFR